jgi:hypothetical protein
VADLGDLVAARQAAAVPEVAGENGAQVTDHNETGVKTHGVKGADVKSATGRPPNAANTSAETMPGGFAPASLPKEKDLAELVERLHAAFGTNLEAVVLYGSAAGYAPNLDQKHGDRHERDFARGSEGGHESGHESLHEHKHESLHEHKEVREYHDEHSDLNVLGLLGRLDGGELGKLRPVGLWWWRKGHPAPLVFTLEELRRSADIFAIELLDMKQRHRTLFGRDFLASFDVPMTLHRLQVERELRSSVIRLRQLFLQSRGHRDELTELMIASASSFAALFRHALIALGEPAPDPAALSAPLPALDSRRVAADRLAARVGFDVAAFHLVLDLRDGKRGAADINPESAFAAYLKAVTQVAEAIDRMLEQK